MKIEYSPMNKDDSRKVFDMVSSVFDEFVKNDFTDEGVEEFYRALGEFVISRPENHDVYAAKSGDEILGMIDIRDNSHISLFFVKSGYHNMGIGKGLMNAILPGVKGEILSVNSSLFAVPVYVKLGFRPLKEAQTVNGIKFVPMERPVE